MTTKQIAERCRVDEKTVCEWVRRGALSPTARDKYGAYRFDPSEVERVTATWSLTPPHRGTARRSS